MLVQRINASNPFFRVFFHLILAAIFLFNHMVEYVMYIIGISFTYWWYFELKALKLSDDLHLNEIHCVQLLVHANQEVGFRFLSSHKSWTLN